jgi:hypothetical protein
MNRHSSRLTHESKVRENAMAMLVARLSALTIEVDPNCEATCLMSAIGLMLSLTLLICVPSAATAFALLGAP